MDIDSLLIKLMIMKYSFVFLCLFSVVACNSAQQIIEIESLEVEKLTGEVIADIPSSCYKEAIIKDSLFVLYDECSDTLFRVYSLNSFSLLKTFGMQGRGPLEFMYPVLVNDTENSDKLQIHDMVHFRFYNVNLKNDTFPYVSYQLPRKLIQTYNVNKVDSLYMATSATNASDSALFFIYNDNSQKNINIPYVPEFKLILDVHPLLDKRSIYSNNIRVSGEKNSIILAFKYFNLINFYDLNGRLKKSYSIKNLIPPIDSREIDISEKTMVTFYQMYATPDFCYLLWRGKPISYDDSEAQAKIFVFDWEGHLFHTYELPHLSSFIAVDEKNTFILGGVLSEINGFVEIYKYGL